VLADIFLLPVLAVSLWLLLPLLSNPGGDHSHLARKLLEQAGYALCLGIVLYFHFQIKLWIPLIRSASYDAIYEAIDRVCFSWLNPLIAWRATWPQTAWINQLYFDAFFLMFMFSFLIHNGRGKSEFRRVFLAVLLMFALGANLYLIVPALGPFLYHPSANAWIGSVQHYLYAVRQSELAGGTAWLRVNSGSNLTCGLAAMPSLHAAASFILLFFAWRYVRRLVWIYAPLFLWICFEAMASRWHYGIDLVAGIALAYGCAVTSERWMRAHEEAQSETADRMELPRDGVAVAS